MSRIRIVIVILGVALSGVLFSTNYAHAATAYQQCSEFQPVFCMNAYGEGPYVKTNPPGAGNNSFGFYRLTGMCNSGYTSTNCPMTGNPAGLQIFELKYQGPGGYSGNCAGDYNNEANQADVGVNVPCGGYGTVFVDASGGGCGSGFHLFVNDKWSGYNWATNAGLGWNPNSNSVQMYLNAPEQCVTEFALT